MLILHYKETFYKLFYMGDDSRQHLCVNFLKMPHLGLVLACLIILNNLGAFVLLPVFLSIFELKLYFPEGGEKEKS